MRNSLLGLWLAFMLGGCSEKDLQNVKKVSNKSWGKVNGVVLTAEGDVRNGLAAAAGAAGQVSGIAGVQAKLMSDPAMKGASVQVTKTKRGVKLSGTVLSGSQYQRAEQLARSVPGVGEVQNHVKIKRTVFT